METTRNEPVFPVLDLGLFAPVASRKNLFERVFVASFKIYPKGIAKSGGKKHLPEEWQPLAQHPQAAARKVFISSLGALSANLGGPARADATCNTLAAAAGLTGTYLAWLSDGTNSPDTRFNKSTVPYIRALDSAIIATNYADLTDGLITNTIVLDENGRNVGFGRVWTHVQNDGKSSTEVATGHCNGWTSASSALTAVRGQADIAGLWTLQNFVPFSSPLHHIYCFEQ